MSRFCKQPVTACGLQRFSKRAQLFASVDANFCDNFCCNSLTWRNFCALHTELGAVVKSKRTKLSQLRLKSLSSFEACHLKQPFVYYSRFESSTTQTHDGLLLKLLSRLRFHEVHLATSLWVLLPSKGLANSQVNHDNHAWNSRNNQFGDSGDLYEMH